MESPYELTLIVLHTDPNTNYIAVKVSISSSCCSCINIHNFKIKVIGISGKDKEDMSNLKNVWYKTSRFTCYI